jgi:hypothetical protein
MSRALALALCCATLPACDTDKREAEALVRAYNEAAILAYRTRNFGDLQKVATKKEWGRVLVLVDLKSAGDLVLEADLQALEIASAQRINDDLLKVTTKERWRYWDRALKPGAPAGTVFVAAMTLDYDFVKDEGVWRMSSARTLTNEYLEPAGFKLDPHGRAHGAADAGPE